ncbi:MAG: lipid II:glycine glycyltransferase FemX [Candidatus Saccharimonadales bacterium]
MLDIKQIESRLEWDAHVQRLGGHPLQLWGWGEVKATYGWRAQRLVVERKGRTIGAVQILYRRMPGLLKEFAYIPRGPVCEEADRAEVLMGLARYVRDAKTAFVLSIEPHWTKFPEVKGWTRARNTVLIPRTALLDLTKTQDELMEQMTKKTRQYIRKSEREALDVRQLVADDEVRQALVIYRETAQRAGFDLHEDDYYLDIFHKLGEASPIYASFSGKEMVAFLWFAASETIAFELYGGMNDKGQELRANYALKWYAMNDLKQQGISTYDVNGLLNDGISSFKLGFAGEETQLTGTWDYPLSPLYSLWATGLPVVKKAVRTVKKLRS